MPNTRARGLSRRNRRGRNATSNRSGADGGMSTASGGAASNKAMLESQARWPKTTFIKFPGVLFPDKLRIKLKYNETVAFSGAISPTAQVWQPNSIFNVNGTAANGNPSFYSAIGTIYKKYVVLGFEAIVEVTSAMTSGSGLQYAVQASDFLSGGKTTIQMREGKWVIGGSVGIIGGGYTVNRKKFPYLTSGEINGQKDVESDPQMYAGIASNPTDIILLTFKATSNDGTNNAAGVVRLTMVMDVVYKEVVDVAT